MRGVAASVPAIGAPSLGGLRQSAEAVLAQLPEAASLLLCHKLAAREAVFSPPPLQLLEDAALRAAAKLPFVHEMKLLEKTASGLLLLNTPPLEALSGLAEQVIVKAVAAHDGRILSAIHGTIRQQKAQEHFHHMVRWAGGDLPRWEKVRRQCRKYPFLRTMYQQETRFAHAVFIELRRQAGTDSDNWRTMLEHCSGNPFMLRELALFAKEQKKQRGRHQATGSPVLFSALDDGATPQETVLPEDEGQNAFIPFKP